MGSTYTTGLTPSKSRQRNGSSCFTEGGTARTGVEQTAVSLTYRNIGPVGGDEVLVTGKETMQEMNELLPTPLPGRKEVNRVVRHPGAANKKDHNKSHEARSEFDKTKKRQTKEKLTKFINLFKAGYECRRQAMLSTCSLQKTTSLVPVCGGKVRCGLCRAVLALQLSSSSPLAKTESREGQLRSVIDTHMFTIRKAPPTSRFSSVQGVTIQLGFTNRVSLRGAHAHRSGFRWL